MSIVLSQLTKTVSVSGTATALSTVTLKTPSLVITANDGNTGKIWVGDEDVSASSSSGTPLDPGEVVEIEAVEYAGTHEVIDLNKLYIDADTSGDSVSVGYYKRIKDGESIIFENNKSLLFDGVDEFVQLGTDNSLDITASLSVSFWVKGAANQVSKSPLSKWSGQGNDRVWLFLTPNPASDKLRIYASEDGAGQRKLYETSITIMDNTWHQVAFTYTGNTLKVYVDGAEDTSVNKIEDDVLTQLYSNNHETVMGRFSGGSGPTGYFAGNVDEVSIWSTQLSDAQISEIYNSGTPGNLAGHSANANLVSWWRNGDAVGDVFPTIQDQSGTNDGTMTNMESGDIVEDVP